jgi:hypothetical protein
VHTRTQIADNIHAVKTQAGISDQTYSSSDEDPLYEEGQEHSVGYCSVGHHQHTHHQSHAQKADGIQFKTPTNLTVKRIMDGFVDDTDHLAESGQQLDVIKDRLEIAAELRRQHNGGNSSCMLQAGSSNYRSVSTTYSIGYSTPKEGTARNTRGNYQISFDKAWTTRRRHYSVMLHDISSHAWRENPSGNLLSTSTSKQRQENGT